MNAIAAIMSSTTTGADELNAITGMMRDACFPTPHISHLARLNGCVLAVAHSGDGKNSDGLCQASRSASVAIDGWIDNCAELARSLGQGAPTSAAETVAAVYAEWGIDGISKLVGDFALALWDPVERMLVCARDFVGVRPLFYAQRGSVFACASQLDQLRRCGWIDNRIDREYFAQLLTTGASLSERTAYEAIKRVMPGTVVTFRDCVATKSWFWRPTQSTGIRSESDAIDGFREHFRTAVKLCRRHRGSVWSELSGGLDSSAIVCTAAHETREDTTPRSAFEALTVDLGYARHSDESKFADEVAQTAGVPHHVISCGQDSFFDRWRECARFCDEPHSSIFAFPILHEYVTLMRPHGVTALLSGMGAEAVATCGLKEPFYLADILKSGKVSEMIQGLLSWQRARKRPMMNMVWRYVLRPLIAPASPTYCAGLNRFANWLTPAAVREFELRRFLRYRPRPRMFRSVADQWHFDRITHVSTHLCRGLLEKAVHVRYPFLYRPLVEFMLSVPWEFKMRPVGTKPIVRIAMRGVVPDSVRLRPFAAITGGHSRYLALARHWTQVRPLAEGKLLAELGLVDPVEFSRHGELARAGYASDLPLFQMALAAEAWLMEKVSGQQGANG